MTINRYEHTFYLAFATQHYRPGEKPYVTMIGEGDRDYYTKEGWVVLPEVFTIKFQIEDKAVTQQVIKTLEVQKKDLMAKTQVAINEIDSRIQNLLALEHSL